MTAKKIKGLMNRRIHFSDMVFALGALLLGISYLLYVMYLPYTLTLAQGVQITIVWIIATMTISAAVAHTDTVCRRCLKTKQLWETCGCSAMIVEND